MANELAKPENFGAIEQVLMTGDLSKLSSEQRVSYYNAVCKSTGLNPLTRPFDYISLNGKLTLYAKKDAADQLRSINKVSIDKPEITFQDDLIIVTVAGRDNTGRSDSEIGVVRKSDMKGDMANALMKAVTKAKRRLTLSICGLGWLDETEIETIPTARPVKVSMITGEIVQQADQEVMDDYPPLPQDWPTGKQAVKEVSPMPAAAHVESKPMNGAPRPYTAPDFRVAIANVVKAYAGKIATPKQTGLVAMLMDIALMDEGNDARHAITQWLFNKPSLKDCDGPEINALLKWLDPQKDNGGSYTPGSHVTLEAKAAYKAAIANGHEVLPVA